MLSAPPISSTAPVAHKYLCVTLDEAEYVLPVLKIKEIIRLQPITPVPGMPEYLRGVINLRGRMLAVMDLRLKFGLKAADLSERACIVVAQVRRPTGQTTQMGMIVDSVEDVVTVSEAEVEAALEFGAGVDARFVAGVAIVKGRLKTLLDIESIVESSVSR